MYFKLLHIREISSVKESEYIKFFKYILNKTSIFKSFAVLAHIASIAWVSLAFSFSAFSTNVTIFCQWSFPDSIIYTKLSGVKRLTSSCSAIL